MHEELRAAVIAYTSNQAYRPVKPKVIAERLGLGGDAAEQLKKTVKKMVRAGELEYGPNHLVMPVDEDHPARGILAPKAASGASPNATANEESKKEKRDSTKYVTGTFRRIGSGDGFVRPEGTPASVGRDEDVFVSANSAGDSANGDIIRIRLSSKRGRQGKFEGFLVDVVERATNKFVGSYFEQNGMGLVQVDGKVFNAPISVGDPGAKGVTPDDKVVIEMVRFPSHVREGEGVITDILGKRGEPGVDTMSVIYEFGLPGPFSEEVLEDSRKAASRFDEKISDGRRDLTDEVIITIDPVDARDFDDAISLERADNGHWLLGVHIADVSHFVQPKTTLDSEAYDRATSVYLPDQVIPMLPEIISNNLASLQPNHVRYAMTCNIEFTPDGAPIGAEVFKSAIKSRRRFTYEEVDQYLLANKLVKRTKPDEKASAEATAEPSAEVSPPANLAPEVDSLLGRMFELAMILRRRRFERGALELSMPEMKIDLDKKGRVTGAHLEQNSESHQIIEEFMLSANEAVARRLEDAGLIFLRRVHGAPDPRKMRVLTDFVRELGFKAENLENRFELQELLDKVQGDPRQHAVNFAALRSLQRAIYSPEEEGHYALASECYCHFTSPIRRYPDLTVHRLLDALNAFEAGSGKKPQQDPATYFQWGDHCSEREQRATQAERELKKVKLLNFLTDKIGMEMEGVITGVESFGLFITAREIPAEGFVHISALADDYYKFDRASHSITGFRQGASFRLGDSVRVAVAAVDVDARELDFRMLGRVATSKSAKRERAKSPKKKRPKPGARKPRKKR